MGGLAALDLTGNTNPPANTSQPPIAYRPLPIVRSGDSLPVQAIDRGKLT